MTAAEAALALVYADLATSVPALATHISAEGALTAWHYNGGAGSYFSTSPYKYSGGVFSSNRRADEVRPLLQASFEADRAAFLDAATDSDDARSWALVDEQPPFHPGARAVTPITWWDPTEYDRHVAYNAAANVRGNLAKPLLLFRSGVGLPIVGTGGRTTPALVAAYLASQPEGARVLTLGDSPGAWGVPVVGGAANGRVAMYEREFDHATRRGLGLATWQTAMLDPASDWNVFWAALWAEGETLLGVGNGYRLLDHLSYDVERAYQFWKLQSGGLGGETWTTIFSDPEWETLRTTFFLPVLSQAVWNTFATWNFSTDERVFLVDAALRADYVAKTAPVWAIPLAFFPRCRTNEYDRAFVAAGTRPVASAAANYATPYGIGATGATDGAFAPYGVDFLARWDRWHWPTLTAQSGSGASAGTAAQRVWRMLIAHVAMLQSIQAASSKQRLHYFSNPHVTQTIFGIAGDVRSWAELVLHAALPDCDTILYTYKTNPDGSSSPAKLEHYQAYIDLVAERDQVVGYAGAWPEPQAPFDEVDVMLRPAIVSKVWAGWRWIWRVTPNPFLPQPGISEVGTSTGPGVRFDWGGDRVLEIPRGKIVRVPGSLATLGWWVEQPVPKRFRYSGCVPVGTTAVQIVPAPLPNWARRLLLRADVDATDLVHLGNSSSVNATNGNANCGMPLDAGEEHTYELGRDSDGGDETGVWAKAASGTQYVHWWAE